MQQIRENTRGAVELDGTAGDADGRSWVGYTGALVAACGLDEPDLEVGATVRLYQRNRRPWYDDTARTVVDVDAARQRIALDGPFEAVREGLQLRAVEGTDDE